MCWIPQGEGTWYWIVTTLELLKCKQCLTLAFPNCTTFKKPPIFQTVIQKVNINEFCQDILNWNLQAFSRYVITYFTIHKSKLGNENSVSLLIVCHKLMNKLKSQKCICHPNMASIFCKKWMLSSSRYPDVLLPGLTIVPFAAKVLL